MEPGWHETVIEGKLEDGTEVVFKCRYWAKDVLVEMVRPYPGARNCVHMMYLAPRRYTDGDLWEKAAWGLVRGILEQKAWVEQHASDCTVRAAESRRRCEILAREVDALRKMMADLRKERKEGRCAVKVYQTRLTGLKHLIAQVEMLADGEREERWVRAAMGRAFFPEGMNVPYAHSDGTKRNIRIYSRLNQPFLGDPPGWRMRLETELTADCLVAMGLKEDERFVPNTLLSEWKKQDDPRAHVLAALVEVDGAGADWRIKISEPRLARGRK